ncbi:EIF3I [Auxenochlorella protothecoides x Auxenochlorella symbiontica]|uniref:Eukaryotic translation initiation factor 3 subunit I n=1 Tax=Auxenochlorella protothecoides TaxID=3075 RepID=A0A087SQS7_AUXPR|nr:Eukaryotic translation initiation factor 3 subunit I [Auxenochlorella protothecoides]KFM28081.1 Eukaryotic translation initiation factor 3 subunit I [Auxenochlorella protothecoides]
MRPFILQGHSRPLNQVKYNREGDLLVTCGKDKTVNLWWTEDGQRAGTFNGHTGAVWTSDISYDSTRLITGGADSAVILWDMNTGEEQHHFRFQEPCRAVKFSVGEAFAAVSSDPFMQAVSAVRILPIAADPAEQGEEAVQTLRGPRGRIARVEWTDQNRTLITASEDGFVRRWDVETGKELAAEHVHEKNIQDLQMSVDGTHFITASVDCSSKLVDTQTLAVLKTYQSNVPVNSAALSPVYDHVILGGGQDASQVTTTSSRAGRFESRFFHKVFQEEFGNVRGHFGPINAVSFSPDGTGFASGGEEGYVRLHKFDADYFTTKFF